MTTSPQRKRKKAKVVKALKAGCLRDHELTQHCVKNVPARLLSASTYGACLNRLDPQP